MNKNLIVLSAVVLVGICAIVFLQGRNDRSSQPGPLADSPAVLGESPPSVPVTPDQAGPPKRTRTSAAPPRSAMIPAQSIQPAAPPPTDPLGQAIHFALDTNTTYGQRQEIWNKFREAGQLDEAMAELEKRAQEDPSNPAIPTSLGQLCLFKAGQMTNSIADQGMLGLKADKVFDQALSLDPSNWEARFWKTTAMSYWPATLNKSREVMENYVALVEQQEAQAPQSQFSQTYAQLGQEYAKGGYPDHAKAIWQRGLKLFPNDSGLKEKLAGSGK